MSHRREDPEIETVLERERSGSGSFEISEDLIEAQLLRHQIEELTPRPGPNYYAHNEHRILCEKSTELRASLIARLAALGV